MSVKWDVIVYFLAAGVCFDRLLAWFLPELDKRRPAEPIEENSPKKPD